MKTANNQTEHETQEKIFAEDGPKKCSGLDTKQYSENALSEVFLRYLTKIKCIKTEHQTPFDTNQKFTFCQFRK